MSPRNRKSGSAIAELGPALMFLLLVVFFPLLNVAMSGLSYFCCSTLTDLQAEKAAVLPKSEALNASGPVKLTVPQSWQKTGIGAFAKLDKPPQTEVSYPVISGVRNVEVSTTFSAVPFIPIPFIPGFPGITQPMQFTFSSKRILEDPANFEK